MKKILYKFDTWILLTYCWLCFRFTCQWQIFCLDRIHFVLVIVFDWSIRKNMFWNYFCLELAVCPHNQPDMKLTNINKHTNFRSLKCNKHINITHIFSYISNPHTTIMSTQIQFKYIIICVYHMWSFKKCRSFSKFALNSRGISFKFTRIQQQIPHEIQKCPTMNTFPKNRNIRIYWFPQL